MNDVYSKIRQGKFDEIILPKIDTTKFMDEVIAENLLMNVDEFEFSVRSFNVFRIEGIVTIGDLVKHSEQSLMRIPNLGRKSINEIKEILKSIGLHLGYEQ